MNGFIKLHRVFKNWEWYTDSNMVQFFIHCLLKANHAEKEWRGVKLKPGQFISGRSILSAETGLSERSIRTCIDRLKKTKELTSQTTNKYTVFTLNSWEKYQFSESSDQQADQQTTTNKKDKKIRSKERPHNDEECLEFFKKICSSDRNAMICADEFLTYWDSEDWLNKKGKPVKDWRATARNNIKMRKLRGDAT